MKFYLIRKSVIFIINMAKLVCGKVVHPIPTDQKPHAFTETIEMEPASSREFWTGVIVALMMIIITVNNIRVAPMAHRVPDKKSSLNGYRAFMRLGCDEYYCWQNYGYASP